MVNVGKRDNGLQTIDSEGQHEAFGDISGNI
jgi:hypothetical protein